MKISIKSLALMIVRLCMTIGVFCAYEALAFLPPAAVIGAINAPAGAFDTRQNANVTQTGPSVINSIIIDNDNRIVAAGFFNNGINTDFLVMRYNPDGSLDRSFNPLGLQPGVVTTDIRGFDDVANWVTIDNNNKIVVAGYSSSRFNRDITVVRYNPDGTLDTTFNPTGFEIEFNITTRPGIVITPVGISTSDTLINDSAANCVVIDNENRIVIAGYSSENTNAFNTDFTLVRYNPDGSLDSSFDPISQPVSPTGQLGAQRGPQLGIVITRILDLNTVANALVIDNSNKIVAAGSIDNGFTFDFMIARYNQNGTLDATFNPSGILSNIARISQQNPNIPTQTSATAGSVIIPGIVTTDLSNPVTNVITPTTAGLANTATGLVATDTVTTADRIYDVKIDNSNKIVVVGSSTNDTDSDFALARYNPNGSLDPTFNPDGISTGIPGTLTVDVSGGDDIARSVLIDNNNKIVTTGVAQVAEVNGVIQIGATQSEPIRNTINAFATMRFNQDGSFDTTFSSGQVPGIVVTSVIPPNQSVNTNSVGNFVVLDNDNNLVTAGFSNAGFGNNATLIRYLDTGALDTEFNPLGLFGPQPGIVITQVLTLSRANDSAFLGVDNSFVPLTPAYIAEHIDLVKSISSATSLFSEPIITSPANGAALSDPVPIITGTAQPRSLVTLIIDDIPVNATQTDGTGVWSVQAPELPDGRHTVIVQSRDTISGLSLASSPVDLSIVTQAPEPPVIIVPKDNSFTDQTALIFTGTAMPGVTVILFINNREAGRVAADKKGNWAITARGLPEGKNTAYAFITDVTGTSSEPSNTISFIIDTKPVQRPLINNPVDNTAINTSNLTVSGQAQAYYPLQLFINKQQKAIITADGSGRWSHTFTDIAPGTYSFEVSMEDPIRAQVLKAGPVRFTVDMQPPAQARVTKLDPLNALIQGIAEPESTVTVLLDNNLLERVSANTRGQWAISPAIARNIAVGQHEIAISVTDLAGNTGPLSRCTFVKAR